MLVESADNRAGAGMAHDDAAPWQQQRLRQILFDGNIAIPSATGKNSLAQSTSRNRRRPAQGVWIVLGGTRVPISAARWTRTH
jgi:hypothetical protein